LLFAQSNKNHFFAHKVFYFKFHFYLLFFNYLDELLFKQLDFSFKLIKKKTIMLMMEKFFLNHIFLLDDDDDDDDDI